MRVTVTSIIKQISQNLRDRYKSGFPIVKELIQNADDAFASNIDLILMQGGVDAPHPLLQGPALVVINNGEFTEEHGQAINSIGYSSKTGNQYAIGRYGLGLKSIFHLCEAFFFISSLDRTLHIINPWAEPEGKEKENDPKYPEWDQISPKDNQAVLNQIQKFVEGTPQYLCLWIPLRQEAHFNRRHPIIRELPGEQDVDLYKLLRPTGENTPDLEIQLSRLLPQLRYIKSIHGYQVSRQNNASLVFGITLNEGFSRLKFPDINKNQLKRFNGQITLQITARRKMIAQYSGAEILLNDPTCERLRNLELWPTHTDEDPNTHELVERKDNAHPHIAVIFSKYPSNNGVPRLHVQNAVHLPLEKNMEWIALDGGDTSFGITLHGWFFVDAGRSEVLGWEYDLEKSITNNEEVMLAWNGGLAQKGTLPAVLIALDHFVTSASLTNLETERLTKALAATQLYYRFQRFICLGKQWTYCYQGNEKSHWNLLSKDEAVLELPQPPESDPDRPLKVFPGLQTIGLVTIAGKPRIATSAHIRHWPVKQIENLLALVPVSDVFSSESLLTYFLDFIKSCPMAQDCQKMLVQIAQQAFSTVDLNILRKNRNLVKTFCAFLDENNWFVMPVQDGSRDAEAVVFRELFQLHLDQLVVPADFTDSLAIAKNIQLETAGAILKTLAAVTNAKNLPGVDEVRTRFALHIFRYAEDARQLGAQYGGLSLFLGRMIDHDQVEETNLSLIEIQKFVRARRLFQFSQNGSEGILRDLSAALLDGRLLIIRRDINSTLSLEAAESSEDGCLPLLQTKVALSEPENRVKLLRSLLNAFERVTIAQRTGLQVQIRYMLHGQPDQYENQEPLLVEESDPTCWSYLIQAILRLRHKEWRHLKTTLSQLIAPGLRSMLSIAPLGETIALQFLRELDQSQLNSLDFSHLDPEQRREILINLSTKDEGLLVDLYIHEKTNGDLVGLDKNTYLDNGFSLPDGLSVFATLLKTPATQQLEAIYRDLGIYPLSHESVIELALSSNTPSRYYLTVLDALSMTGELREETLNLLREKEWIPTKDNVIISPNRILHLNKLQKEISKLLKTVGSDFISLNEVSPQVCNHSSINKIKDEVLSTREDVLNQLGNILIQKEEFRIGEISIDRISSDLVDWLIDAFGQVEDQDLLPSISFIEKIRKNLTNSDALVFSRFLCGQIQKSRLIKILNHLSKVHETASLERKPKLLRLHNIYLELAVKSFEKFTEFRSEFLPNIRLMNSFQKWKSTNCLTYQADGIDADDLLSDEQARVLNLPSKARNVSSEWEEEEIREKYEGDLNGSRQVLGRYFEEWVPYIQNPEVLGGFLCLLGEQMRELAEKYLGQRGVDETREILEWMEDAVTWRKRGTMRETIQERMARQFFWVKVVDVGTKTVPVISLIGTEFEAKLEEKFTHLLYESPPTPSFRNDIYDYLCMRKVNLEEITPERRIELIKNTAQIILLRVYAQDITNIDDFWKQLEHSDQLDIEIAQDTILENAFHYIPSLGLGTHEYFHLHIKKWEDNRSREIQARKNAESKGRPFNNDSYEREKIDLRTVIKNIFESQDEKELAACYEILKAIRTRIGDEYQYKRESMLFELFQNADDAVVELGVLFDSSGRNPRRENKQGLSDDHRKVVVDWDDTRIRFAHWGRGINQIHPGNGERYGYGSDLVKMLTMLRSDKRIAPELDVAPLTGKFGLGFKSVYLVTNQPSIISGRLKFRISSGLYPARMSNDEVLELSKVLSSWSPGENQGGTIIDLPFDKQILTPVNINEVVQSFYRWAHLLIIFAHQINQIDLLHKGIRQHSIHWDPQRVSEELDWYIGRLCAYQSDEPIIALIWRYGSKDTDTQGNILVEIKPSGCVPLAADIPKLWVTVPTQDQLPIKFALNGLFALDIGRAQLARSSEQNHAHAEKLGKNLGIALLGLFNFTASQWDSFAKMAELSERVSFQEFWKSLWKVVFEVDSYPERNVGTGLISDFLGSKDAVIEHLYRKANALPAGLSGDYDVLTCLGEVQFWVSETLGTPEVFRKISQWPQFRAKAKAGAVVSKKTRDSLYFWLQEKPLWQEITLWKAIFWAVGEKGRVKPAQAELIGGLITSEFMNGLDKQERESLQLLIRKLEFETDNGDYRPVTELLTTQFNLNEENEVDEFYRAMFAPKGLVLSKDYQSQTSISFFRACRDRLFAPVEKMADWVLMADDQARRVAVLNYLLQGALAGKLADELLTDSKKPVFDRSWLMELSSRPELLKDFDEFEKARLFSVLHLTEEWTKLPEPELSVDALLDSVYLWWCTNREELLSDYVQDIYPARFPEELSIDTSLLDSASIRQEWLILFLLGSSHRIGRLRPTTYRNFSQFCMDKGWLQIFSKPYAQSEEWIQILDDYLKLIADENDAKYQYLFVRQFVDIYNLSRHLVDFVEILLSINRMKARFPLEQIAIPNESPLFSGAGYGALPKLTGTLGEGLNFVIRELVRRGVITSQHAWEHCFAPVPRLQRLFSEYGIQDPLNTSPEIFRFFVRHLGEEKATFMNSFDIPFLMIQERYGSFNRFLYMIGNKRE